MYGGRVCIGALSEEGENLRLMNANCASSLAAESPYLVGDEWEIVCSHCGARKPPHVEDVAVSMAARIGSKADLKDYIVSRSKQWRGPIDALFDGKIRFTGNGGGYVAEPGISSGATGFWLPFDPAAQREG
jgi:hypothetical protein